MKRIVNDYIHYIQDSLSIGDQRSFVKFVNSMHTPYSRHGHGEQKARLGRQICASVRQS